MADGARGGSPARGAEAAQAEVVAFLSDPSTHGGAPVERVVTHVSRLFLAGDRAWKLKRAVRTNYLDFTSLQERERACRREIEVNARAGDLYLGVAPVTRGRDGRLAIDGGEEVADWLVAMRRFDRARELDRLLEAGRLNLGAIDALADEVAALHAAAPLAPAFGDPEDVRRRIEQIAAAAAEATGEGAKAEAWRRRAQAERAARAAFVERRRAAGLVRRVHGDLHLGNVVMLDERPTPFDAIEFDEAIASTDILYDVAFALADLAIRGRPDLANTLLGRWLSATGDHEGLALLPLFLSMRAMVRAMTLAAKGEPAARALGVALAVLEPLPPSRLLAVGGISGSGKTSLARRLAPRLGRPLGAVHIRSDVARKRLFDVAPEAALPNEAYGSTATRRVYAGMLRSARRALRSGASVVLDATFLDSRARRLAARAAASVGARFDGLWLELGPEEAARRVGGRPADASDATPEVVTLQARRAGAPEDWTRLDARADLSEIEREAGAALDLEA